MKRSSKRNQIGPLTSERQLKNEVTKRNALNKQRAKAMERRIAQVLRGRRVPMSGAAAQYKGDVEIPFENYPGKYIIECKLSAQIGRNGQPQMRVVFDWFPKIHQEARSMAAKFGILIIHFKQFGNDYVFVRHDVLEMIMNRYQSPFTVDLYALLRVIGTLDWRYDQKGNPRSGYNVQRRELEDNMIAVNGLRGVKVIVPDGEYIVLPLEVYRTITAHM